LSSTNTAGRVAVITGASSGIGEATARALAADGHRVALLARRSDRIENLAAELGDDALAITADVTDRDSLVAASDQVRDKLGGADILVNNAGIMLLGPFGAEQHEVPSQRAQAGDARWGYSSWSCPTSEYEAIS
jgi:NADP-dependent 3-hydroxy acid dehydrogenase YdfG